ncbi:MAG TPA: 4-alpha-glucanotransferase [Nevskiaceae bacterium]|nr:4-alpha-glucanotransferase [Nevskiaceae bacterium]
MSDALTKLAEAAGLVTQWRDFRNEARTVGADTLRAILDAMELPCASPAQIHESLARVEQERRRELPSLITAIEKEPITLPDGQQLPGMAQVGYHALSIGDREITLAVAPRRALGPRAFGADRKLFGIAAQLYSLRRKGDGGIGDFTALAELARRAAPRGADAIAVSPVHALFAAQLDRFSPYAPSSRLFLNALHADPAAILGPRPVQGVIDALGIGPELQHLEQLELVDWPAAGRARQTLLRGLYDELKRGILGKSSRSIAARDFADFKRTGGEALADHARFEAIHAHQLNIGGPWNWRDWPGGLDDARSDAVREFAKQYADEVDFHLFKQWLADRGLAKAQAIARASGMAIGLVSDLAVGTDGGGSHAWSRRHDFLVGLSVGAPPDEMNLQGQSWGLTTFSPRALTQHGYAPFLEMLRAALRHAGGMRIDHVLGLNRLWLVPEGASATDGAYLKYPLRDLLRLIALESVLHRALIIGEDLGTVPEGFQDTLAEAGLLGMRVLWFEREHGLFRDPSRWSPDAVAMTSTHDVPPVARWWKEQEEDDRRALWAAFRHAGLVQSEPPPRESPQSAVDAALRFVARTPSRLAMLPLEDVVGLDERPNVPGTTDEHPNWRRRLPRAVDTLLETPEVSSRLDAVRIERGRS